MTHPPSGKSWMCHWAKPLSLKWPHKCCELSSRKAENTSEINVNLHYIFCELLCFLIEYRPQRSWAKVMFLQVSVILPTGGGGFLPQCILGYTPPQEQTPLEQTPLEQTPQSRPPWEQTPPGANPPEQTPQSRHPPGRWLRHTVNERPVRILLECILDFFIFQKHPHYNIEHDSWN